MANPNDGTQLGSGEIISDEYVDPSLNRGDKNIPQTGYKLPRSKIALGDYGTDLGDVSAARPLPVDSIEERRLAEIESLRARERSALLLCRSAYETVSRVDSRGHDISNRGVR